MDANVNRAVENPVPVPQGPVPQGPVPAENRQGPGVEEVRPGNGNVPPKVSQTLQESAPSPIDIKTVEPLSKTQVETELRALKDKYKVLKTESDGAKEFSRTDNTAETLSKTQLKTELRALKDKHKVLKTQSDGAKALAFGKTLDEDKEFGRTDNTAEKMKNLAKYHTVQKELAKNKADLKAKRRELETTSGTVWRKVKTHAQKGIVGVSRLSCEGRPKDIFLVPKQLRADLLDKKNCKTLIAEGQARLIKGGLTEDEKTIIENGINQLQEHIDKKASTGDQAAKLVLSGVSLIHTAVTLTYVVSKLASVVSTTIHGIPIVGQAIYTATLPFTASLCLDGLYAIKSNLRQVAKDRNIIGNNAKKLEKAYQENLQLHDISAALDNMMDVPDSLKNNIKALAIDVSKAREEINSANKLLLTGNLSKEDIRLVKFAKSRAKVKLEESLGKAIAALEPYKEDPAIQPLLNKARAKQVLGSGMSTMQDTINPYLTQRLKAKRMSEWVRAAGETMGLAAAAIGTVGLVATIATGGAAGVPLLIAGGVLGLVSVATIYGGGALVNQLQKMQLGKNYVDTKTFNAAILSQLKKEVDNWDNLEAERLTGNTTASAVFEVVAKHYPGRQDWDTRKWAEELVNDPAEGPEHKRFEEAMNTMLYHDTSRGAIGTLTKKMVGAVENKFGSKRSLKAA